MPSRGQGLPTPPLQLPPGSLHLLPRRRPGPRRERNPSDSRISQAGRPALGQLSPNQAWPPLTYSSFLGSSEHFLNLLTTPSQNWGPSTPEPGESLTFLGLRLGQPVSNSPQPLITLRAKDQPPLISNCSGGQGYLQTANCPRTRAPGPPCSLLFPGA